MTVPGKGINLAFLGLGHGHDKAYEWRLLDWMYGRFSKNLAGHLSWTTMSDDTHSMSSPGHTRCDVWLTSALWRRGHSGWTQAAIRHVKYCRIIALASVGVLFTEKLPSEGTQTSRTAHDPSVMLTYPTESQKLGPKQCNDAETVMPNYPSGAYHLRLRISV
jgi:hypothetical protein